MIKDLLNYQSADAKLRKIEVELSSSPARKKAASAKVYIEGVNENVNKLDDKAERLSSEVQSIIEEQKNLLERLAELQKAMNEAQDENEVNYLIKKTEELTAQIKALVASLNKNGDESQKVVKEFSGIRAQTKSAQAQYAESREEYDKLKASYKEEMEAINKELESLKKSVDAGLMEKYQKKRANKIFPIVYQVNSGVCGYCNMELSMLELNKLKNGEVIECDQCGRILYQNADK